MGTTSGFCVACRVGQFKAATGNWDTHCKACAAGKRQPQVGQGTCLDTPAPSPAPTPEPSPAPTPVATMKLHHEDSLQARKEAERAEYAREHPSGRGLDHDRALGLRGEQAQVLELGHRDVRLPGQAPIQRAPFP